jgi:hypothetical protein
LSDDVVTLTVASSESEAAMICGYLESQGIRATYDKGGVFQPLGGLAGEGLGFVGRQQILVRADDLSKARAALAARPS